MSPYITTKHKYLHEASHNRPRESVRFLISLNVTSLAFVLAAILGYLWLLNLLVSHSYTVKHLGERLTALQETGEKLTRDITVLRSLESLSANVAPLGLVAAEKISYPKSQSAVARSGGLVLP